MAIERGTKFIKRPPQLRDGLFFTNQAVRGVGGWGERLAEFDRTAYWLLVYLHNPLV
jgi:hypothetical protein